MSALRLVLDVEWGHPVALSKGKRHLVGVEDTRGWTNHVARPVDRDRLARVIHLVPSSRTKVGKAILAGDDHARLRAKRGPR